MSAPDRPRNLVVVVLDSLRYDSWVAAEPETLAALGPVERRWSYATWTAPSHYNLLMGLLPHTSPPRSMHPSTTSRTSCGTPSGWASKAWSSNGYCRRSSCRRSCARSGTATHARVSMPVLNPKTIINRDFDSYEFMPTHNDMAAMLRRLNFDEAVPSFYLLNVGETHYPYARPDEDPSTGHGSPACMASSSTFDDADDEQGAAEFFDQTKLAELQDGRSRRSRYLDGVIRRLFDRCPRHLGDRDLRPRRAVRRGPLLRSRADHAREGARGSVRRGLGALAGAPPVGVHQTDGDHAAGLAT